MELLVLLLTLVIVCWLAITGLVVQSLFNAVTNFSDTFAFVAANPHKIVEAILIALAWGLATIVVGGLLSNLGSAR